MSIIVKLSEFNTSDKDKLAKDLKVEASFENESSTSFKNKTVLYTFDIPDDNNIYLPLSYVYHHHDKHFKFKEYPRMNPDVKISTLYRSLKQSQKEIVPEAFDILNRTHSLILQCGCGFGKTYFSIFLAFNLNYKTVILIHRITLIDQWKETIINIFPKAIIQVVDTNCEINKDAHFYIMNMTTPEKRDRKDFENIGLLIADEIHVLPTECNSRSLFYFTPKYLIGLSATPDRESDNLSQLLYLYFGIEIIIRELYRPFNVYTITTDFVPDSQLSKTGNLDWNSVLSSISDNNCLRNLIVNISRYFSTRNILILCKRKDNEAKLIYEELKKYDENVELFVSTKKKYNYNCRILVSTYSKTGVGFNFPKLDMLISASDIEIGCEQYFGRVCRKDDTIPIFIDFIHKKFYPCYKHFLTREKVYMKLGGIIKSFSLCFPEFFKLY